MNAVHLERRRVFTNDLFHFIISNTHQSISIVGERDQNEIFYQFIYSLLLEYTSPPRLTVL